MKVLVTGVNGQLGFDVIKILKQRNIDHIGTTRKEFDITNKEQVKSFIENYMPDVVVHCAAYTAVDKAESESELCEKVNQIGTKNIVQACKQIDAEMVYISTDYVFEGTGTKPYEIDDKTNPISVYGKTKLLGELEVKNRLEKYFIVRVSWVFGKNGSNFVKTMLRLGKEKEEINVVCDQIGSPTYTADLAVLLCDMIQTDKYGIYHATNEGYCSWADFATEIFKQAGIFTKVNAIPSHQYPTAAKRPFNSRLSKISLDKNGFSRLPNWQDAIFRYLKEL